MQNENYIDYLSNILSDQKYAEAQDVLREIESMDHEK